MDITRIDRNFSTEPVNANGFLFRDVKQAPFRLEGLGWYEENGHAFYRLPKTMTEAEINAGALSLANHTSGVCVRFRSDTPELVIRAKLANSCDMSHMPRAGSMGFDTYRKLPGGELLYNRTIKPAPGTVELETECGKNPDGLLCEWVVNFPLYGGVEKVEIGLKEGCMILPPLPHRVPHPVLFYGSSITQGGCASRPGNAYSSMLCRQVDAEQINLGFSGNGKGEIAVAKAIGGLKLSAFIMDYDHNAPTPEHLEATHEPFFRAVRKAQPDLPVIILSMCDIRSYILHSNNPGTTESTAADRREIIRRTWQHAVDAGDRNVYFIDGETLFGKKMYDACTVDGCHPNDLGFYRMFKHVLPVLKTALKANRKGKRK